MAPTRDVVRAAPPVYYPPAKVASASVRPVVAAPVVRPAEPVLRTVVLPKTAVASVAVTVSNDIPADLMEFPPFPSLPGAVSASASDTKVVCKDGQCALPDDEACPGGNCALPGLEPKAPDAPTAGLFDAR